MNSTRNHIFVPSLTENVMGAKNLHSSEEVIYSTYPEFEYEYANIHEQTTLKPEDQELIISLEKRKIDGAPVTVISGFVGKRMDLICIGDKLSEVCRTDGSTRMYEIILLRDVRKRAYVYLRNSGYKVRFALEH